MLTSVESRAMLEEKEKKKREEQEEKERRKKEREARKLAKEEEKKRKEQEREAKKAERQKKAEERQKKADESAKVPRGRKRGESSTSRSQPKRQKVNQEGTGLQRHEISLNECAVCFGLYEEDIDDTTGTTTAEWIQCTNKECSVWCHVDCLEKVDGEYICTICDTLFS